MKTFKFMSVLYILAIALCLAPASLFGQTDPKDEIDALMRGIDEDMKGSITKMDSTLYELDFEKKEAKRFATIQGSLESQKTQLLAELGSLKGSVKEKESLVAETQKKITETEKKNVCLSDENKANTIEVFAKHLSLVQTRTADFQSALYAGNGFSTDLEEKLRILHESIENTKKEVAHLRARIDFANLLIGNGGAYYALKNKSETALSECEAKEKQLLDKGLEIEEKKKKVK